MKTYEQFKSEYNLDPRVKACIVVAGIDLKYDALSEFYKSQYERFCKCGPIRRFFIIRGLF